MVRFSNATLVEPFLLESIYLITGGSTETPLEELSQLVDTQFGAPSTQAYYDILNGITLKGMSLHRLVLYVARFKEAVASHEDFGDEEKVVEIFIKNLARPRLSDRVSSEVDTAERKKDLDFAMKKSFEEMKEMLAMRDEVLHHSKDFGIVLRESEGKRRFQPQESFRKTGTDRFKRHASAGASKEIRCFKCGRVGHKAYECKYTKRSDKPQSVKNVPENGHHILLSLEEGISWPKPCSPLRDHSLG
ncbi:hypothetical protein ADUPG1_013020, partial [Aduncisulcus paluster]